MTPPRTLFVSHWSCGQRTTVPSHDQLWLQPSFNLDMLCPLRSQSIDKWQVICVFLPTGSLSSRVSCSAVCIWPIPPFTCSVSSLPSESEERSECSGAMITSRLLIAIGLIRHQMMFNTWIKHTTFLAWNKTFCTGRSCFYFARKCSSMLNDLQQNVFSRGFRRKMQYCSRAVFSCHCSRHYVQISKMVHLLNASIICDHTLWFIRHCAAALKFHKNRHLANLKSLTLSVILAKRRMRSFPACFLIFRQFLFCNLNIEVART